MLQNEYWRYELLLGIILIVRWRSFRWIETNLLYQIFSLYSLSYAEACNGLAGPISASLLPDLTASFGKMSQLWRAVGNTLPDLNLRPPAPEANELPLDQLAVFGGIIIRFHIFSKSSEKKIAYHNFHLPHNSAI